MPNTVAETIPFRLTIGVTGHRRLENTGVIRKTVRRILDDILLRHPGTLKTPVRLCCLSPLAEGADRLVATEVLEYEDATLKAVLPLSVSDYRRDFTTPEARQEFSNLLKKSRTPVTLRRNNLADDYPAEIISEARSLAYERVGRYVVQNCDILIGIWDGKPPCGSAGTGSIIAFAEQERCPRYIIRTDRPDSFEFIADDSRAEVLFAKIDLFNTKKPRTSSRDTYSANVYAELFEKPDIPEGGRLSAQVRERIQHHLIPFYADASLAAKHYQTVYRRTGAAVFWLAFTAMALVGAGAVFWNAPAAIFIIEFLILSFIASLLFYADRKKRAHKNWMQYRFLTERIRTAFFLAVSGLEPAQLSAVRQSGSERDADAWMNIAFEEIWNRMPHPDGCAGEDPHLVKRYLEKAWIDEQISFHDITSSKNRIKSERLERFSEIIFYIAITAAALHVVAPGLFSWFHSRPVENSLTFIALILPALGATIESIRSHRSYKHIARNSRHMYTCLDRLKNAYRPYHPALLERYVKEAEELMLTESEEWMSLVSFSELYKAV